MRRLDRGRRGERVLVPALVVGGADGVDVAVHEAGTVGHVRAPHVDRGRAPGVEAVHELRGRVDVLGLAAVVPVAGDLVGEVPRHDAGVQPRLQDVQAHAADRAALLHGRARRPCARRIDGPTPCQTRIPAASSRSSSAVAKRVLAAGGVGADGLQPRDDRVGVGVGERVAAARRVLLQRGAVQLQRLAVERQPPAAQRSSRRPTRAVKTRLAGDLEAQILERRWPGSHRCGRGIAPGRGRWRRRRGRASPARSAAGSPASVPRTAIVRGPARLVRPRRRRPRRRSR